MVKQVGFNWRNDYITCSEVNGCYYVNKKCFNPHHMSLKEYESHFKAKMTLRTMTRFKKAVAHYLPGDNVIHSIIEQTRFMKKSETDTVVKKWEANWLSGAWNEAITHADSLLDKQEYQSLVKIMIHYVRLFVHSEAKYATQDYLKAVMMQEYLGEIFTDEHYKTLTTPWLEGKHLSEPHYWKYNNRHLNVDTQSLAGVLSTTQSYNMDVSFSTVEELFRNETEPDFIQEESFNTIFNTPAVDVSESTPSFWVEKMSQRDRVVKEETHGENNLKINVTYDETKVDNVNTPTQLMDLSEIGNETIIPEETIPSKDKELLSAMIYSVKEVAMRNKIMGSVSKPINKVAEYLGYSVDSDKTLTPSEHVDYQNFIEQAFGSVDAHETQNYEGHKSEELAELVKKMMSEKQEDVIGVVSTHETVSYGVNESAVDEDFGNVPEHLQDFIKTIYFK